MNLNQLRVFATVAAEGSVTRAAQQLSVSQPAISRQIADLEEDLGVALFDRLPRGMRPTAAGELLEGHARRILAAEASAEAELAELSGLGRGRLSVGASTTIGSYLVPELFGAYHRAHRSVRLELEIANTAVIQAAVLDNRVDVGLTEGFVFSDQLDVDVVAHDDMVAIAAPGHRAAAATGLTMAELSALPFIMRERGSGTRDVIEAELGRLSLHVEPEMSLGSTESVKNAVASGLGVAIVSRLTVALELGAGRLVELPVPELQIHRALHLIRLRGKQPSPPVEAFVALLQARQRAVEAGTGAYAI
ncbi:MAG: LysR family transcriptional regulator [Myxococcales bacterium]|nr:LysR family transcriptional regulator [Myxococcales bacterium]